MLSLKSMVTVEIEKGYNENTAPAKVCQDIIDWEYPPCDPGFGHGFSSLSFIGHSH